VGTHLVLAVDGISAPDAASRSATRAIVAPASASLSVWAVTSHVTSIAADATDDVGSVVLLFRAVPLAMANLATILASLVLIITEGSVQRRKLAELVALELVLALGNGSSLSVC
jgi:hypothetical protein